MLRSSGRPKEGVVPGPVPRGDLEIGVHRSGFCLAGLRQRPGMIGSQELVGGDEPPQVPDDPLSLVEGYHFRG